MADGVEFDISEITELSNKLRAISETAAETGTNAGLRQAARLLARAAARGASDIDDPKSAENISKNIWAGGNNYTGVRKRSKRSNLRAGSLGYRVGVAGGAGGNKKSDYYKNNPGLDTRHWRFWEFGSENNMAKPFMRPAFSQNINNMVNEFAKEFQKHLDRAIKRAKKVN